MNKKLTILFTALSLIFMSTPGFAQEGGGESTYFEDSFRDVSIVGATAVGGAVLGLSTLSFVDEPGDHLKNIVVGAAVGIILGVGLVAYMAATKNKNKFEENSLLISPDEDVQFATATRTQWHSAKHSAYNSKSKDPSLVGYQFAF
ncbi:MAG: hypothetical protein CME70_05270 [Halobacteriovorax sp.]|nr:hypothetical protein [Halobacteriovorax sp.]|tara:strand:+ start:80748 stop:81185 length:438 start_codon:yes stop_codon:yes gene_type:complete